jgi:hypothetical protein
LPYKREDLFALHQISFAIELAITTFFEITKNNEIIYEVDFLNDRVQEIHTKYNGEPESWGWQENVKEILSKVNPISNIVIRDQQDIYNILTNKEKLEYLFQEYVKENNLQLEKEELEESGKEQQILLNENQQNITDFLLDNKESIRIEDLKIYEPIYKCYRKKGNCHICNTISNIIIKNCSNYKYNNNNKDTWICASHWQHHTIENY